MTARPAGGADAQSAREESPQVYRDIFEHLGIAATFFRSDTIIRLANPSFAKLVGIPRAELEGRRSWTEFVHPLDLERMREYHRLRRQDPRSVPVVYEFRFRAGSGEYRHALVTVTLLPDTLDSVAAFFDITERKRAEETLGESEEQYRTIFENTATANIIAAEDTTILLANTNFERLTGYSRRELEGRMSWTRLVVPEDLEKMKRYHFQRRVDPGMAPRTYEFRALVRSGEIKDIYMSVAMIPGTTQSIASLIDISERKRAEEALRQNEERFRDLARHLPGAVFECDTQGTLTFVNQNALERFGFTQEEVDRGLSLVTLVASQDWPRARANMERVLGGDQLGLTEYEVRCKDGTSFPALVHTVRLMRRGRPEGLRGILLDMTEKKRYEDQLLRAQKMEAIGTLAGGIAHDFNNLLTGILGNISLMQMETDASHPFHERLVDMEQYVKRGSDLTGQLLGFARGGSYEVRPTDLAEFGRTSAEMFGRTRKEISIHVSAEEGLWPVEVDRGQMEQVLLNLFLNASQAMPGGGDLFLGMRNDVLDEGAATTLALRPGRFVELTVRDTGCGMDETTRSHIFEPFFSTRERGRGTGLGLASAYGIVRHHGGAIRVESAPGAGTTFTLHLPATDKPVEVEPVTVDDHASGQETILLIDDEPMILKTSARMLEGLGYRVLAAAGGREGLDAYRRNKASIDLVILDMIMPGMGGKETFEALHDEDPGVRVLLSSGYSIDGQAREILAAGCKGFIQKPFGLASLSRKLRELLEHRD